MIGWKLKALAGVSVALVVVSLGSWAHYERANRKAAEKELEGAQASIIALTDKIQKERESAERVEELAKNVQEQLNETEDRYDAAIARSMRNGGGLYVSAECPDRVPEPSATTGEPDATRARLDRSTELDILRLRRDSRRAEVMISGLQDYIESECVAKKEPR